MARFVDLGDDAGDNVATLPDHAARLAWRAKLQAETHQPAGRPSPGPPPAASAIDRAFRCYPIITSLVSNIDLNTLDALARSCRSVHDSLIQFRSVLLNSTLHCVNENVSAAKGKVLRYRPRVWGTWGSCLYMGENRPYASKACTCARDMVDACRKCGDVVCRNCAIKPPSPMSLLQRYRRLCGTCVKAPLAALAVPPLDAGLPPTSDAVKQSFCQCVSDVWICRPCGSSICAADQEYRSICRWRTQYGELLGGLGTGIGDGDRGVICGRGEACLAARDLEHEVDCDAADARRRRDALWPNEQPVWTTTSTPSPPALAASASPVGSPFGPATPLESWMTTEEEHHEQMPSPQLGPGYERHEIEGIGGRVKRKLVCRIRVGACVSEWHDETVPGGNLLAPEHKGSTRSWCGWCDRVIPGGKDLLTTA